MLAKSGWTFGCEECDSASISIIGQLTDAADVYCSACGFHMGSWGEIRAIIEQYLERFGDNHLIAQSALIALA